MGTAETIGLVAAILTLVGVVAGPFVGRYVRTLGKVRCTLDSWYPQRTGYSSSGSVAEERRLQVTFENGKDLPVIVSEMRVEFYKEGQPLEAWTCPNLAFVDEREHSSPLGPVNIPPHESRQQTISVTPGRDDITRELQKADRAVFVARIGGVEYHRLELTPPW